MNLFQVSPFSHSVANSGYKDTVTFHPSTHLWLTWHESNIHWWGDDQKAQRRVTAKKKLFPAIGNNHLFTGKKANTYPYCIKYSIGLSEHSFLFT